MKLNKQIVEVVVAGLVADGYKIYGDKCIGYKAFKGDLEFDIDGFLSSSELDSWSDEYSDLVSIAVELLDKNKVGNHSDCPNW